MTSLVGLAITVGIVWAFMNDMPGEPVRQRLGRLTVGIVAGYLAGCMLDAYVAGGA